MPLPTIRGLLDMPRLYGGLSSYPRMAVAVPTSGVLMVSTGCKSPRGNFLDGGSIPPTSSNHRKSQSAGRRELT